MLPNKTIRLDEWNYSIEGDPKDPYFLHLEEIAIAQSAFEKGISEAIWV